MSKLNKKDKILRERQERAAIIYAKMQEVYGEIECTLDAKENAWELLVAAILAAQCTDARVNLVTPALFQRFPTPNDFAVANPQLIEPYISSCGLFRNKAKAIYGSAKVLVEQFDGVVPDNLTDLLSLPGVGRKIANLILGEIFGKQAIVVDTHCGRISNLLGLVDSKQPLAIEKELTAILPENSWCDWGHYMVNHGRTLCSARKPKCDECFVKSWCAYGQKN